MALRQRGKNGYWHAYFRRVPGFDANRAKLGKTVSPDLKKEFFIQFKPIYPTKPLEMLTYKAILGVNRSENCFLVVNPNPGWSLRLSIARKRIPGSFFYQNPA